MDAGSARELTATQVTEVEICRNNLFYVFRMAIKSVIDLYFVNKLTESSPELHNMLVIFEKLINFDYKPSSKYPSVWYFIRNCDSVLCKFARHKSGQTSSTKPRSDEQCCDIFDQVLSLDTKQTTDRCRVRVWARMCLMHKRFSHHFKMFCSRSSEVLASFYGSLSMFHLKDQMAILCDDLVGLNSLDFTFQLKDEDFMDYVFVIDYTPYLTFTQCPESQQVDDLEMRHLHGGMNGSHAGNEARQNGHASYSVSLSDEMSQAEFEDDNLITPEVFAGSSGQTGSSAQKTSLGINLMLHGDVESLTAISNDELRNSHTLRIESPQHSESGLVSRSASAVSLSSGLFAELVNQKSFLEELLSQKTNQVEVLKAENEKVKHQLKMARNSSQNERQDYEAIIIELQQQLTHLSQSRAPSGSSSSQSKANTGAKQKTSQSGSGADGDKINSKFKAAHPL